MKKYIVAYTAKRKNAKRHVVSYCDRPRYFDSVEEAKQCYMFKNPHYDAQVMTAKYEPVGTFYTADRETRTIIDEFATIAEAAKAIEEYEKADKADGTYEPNFYDIVEVNN